MISIIVVGSVVMIGLVLITCGWIYSNGHRDKVIEGKEAFPYNHANLSPIKRRPGMDQEHDLVVDRLPPPHILEPLPDRDQLYTPSHI